MPRTTFGSMPTSLPPGMFKAVRIPVLAEIDKLTGNGDRYLVGEGGGVRFVPQPIRFQYSDIGGHDGAVPSGVLHEIVLDAETGEFSGRGFLADDPAGRMHARMIATHMQDRNSVDLGDLKGEIVEDMQTGDYYVRFTEWKQGATTGVSKPAFADAHFEVDGMTPEEMTASLIADEDEIMASLLVDPMEELVAQVCPVDFEMVGMPAEEVVASNAILAPHEAFYQPEAEHPTKIIVTADGRVFGHLAVWNTCHEGIVQKCTVVPRPTDGYASFNQPGVLTEAGQVHTGPIFALGGHPKPGVLGNKGVADAYGSIENAWCDVRVIEGQHGPWLSGIVRPGVAEEIVYAARASRISGHWIGGKLKAIVSVNVPGYAVDGTPDDLAASFSFSLDDDGVSELVASFPQCLDAAPDGSTQLTLVLNVSDMSSTTVTQAVLEALGEGVVSTTVLNGIPPYGTASSTIAHFTSQPAEQDDDSDDDLLAMLIDEPDL